MPRLPISFLMVLLALPSGAAQASQRPDPAALQTLMDRLESRIPRRACSSPRVSKVDVAWHLDHSLKVVNSIHDALADSDPKAYRPSFNPLRALVFTTGKLARGKGKAPEFTRPPETIRTEDLEDQLRTARGNLSAIAQLPEKSHFEHPAFGVLHRDRALRFLEIHTNHHLSIIDDIVADCSRAPPAVTRGRESSLAPPPPPRHRRRRHLPPARAADGAVVAAAGVRRGGPTQVRTPLLHSRPHRAAREPP